jgi:hypothetical protein
MSAIGIFRQLFCQKILPEKILPEKEGPEKSTKARVKTVEKIYGSFTGFIRWSTFIPRAKIA